MKPTRILSLLLAALLLLLSLSGCGNHAKSLDDLKETDELVIYLPERMFEYKCDLWLIDQCIIPYRELYGEGSVRLVIVPGSLEEYEERVTSDVLTGGGPDILFLKFLPHLDVEKAARNHSFYDLTDIMASDPEFSEDDYVSGIMGAGRIGGRQYLVPLTYRAPVFFSVEEKLEELGFSPEEIGTTTGFMEELARIAPKAAENEKYRQLMEGEAHTGMEELLNYSGIRLLDYETGTVLPDGDAFRAFLESYKALYPYDYERAEEFRYWMLSTEDLAGGAMIFGTMGYFSELYHYVGHLKEMLRTAAFVQIPGQNEGTVGVIENQIAINGGSKNVLNAWRFIKLMLSEELQNETSDFFNIYEPVNRSSLRNMVYGGSYYAGLRSYYAEKEMDEIFCRYTEMDRFVQKTASPAVDMMRDAMLPYLQDEKSYDDCLAELKNKLTFYLSE